MADLPAAVGPTSTPPTGSAATNTIDPSHMALNITPYDEDNTAAAGTTTLRHIDQSTRLAWSADTGGVQADPYRWGHAYLPGYTPPAGRPTTPTTPNVSHPNLDGALSPQTIYQSARDGVPISGRNPAPADDQHLEIRKVEAEPAATAELELDAHRRPGTAHVFLWTGDHGAIPVFLTSCAPADRPAAGLRLQRLRDDRRRHPAVVAGHERPRRRPPGRRHDHEDGQAEGDDPARRGAARQARARTARRSISFETPNDEVQALFVPDFDKK